MGVLSKGISLNIISSGSLDGVSTRRHTRIDRQQHSGAPLIRTCSTSLLTVPALHPSSPPLHFRQFSSTQFNHLKAEGKHSPSVYPGHLQPSLLRSHPTSLTRVNRQIPELKSLPLTPQRCPRNTNISASLIGPSRPLGPLGPLGPSGGIPPNITALPHVNREIRPNSFPLTLKQQTRSSRSIARASLIGPGPLGGLASAAIITGAMALLSRFNGQWYEQKCEVVTGNGPAMKYVMKDLEPILEEPYRPYLPVPNQHFETIFAAFFRTLPDVVFRRECLRTPDGGAVALDWPLDTHQLADVMPAAPGAPVIILLPGLTGGSEDTYVRHMLIRARHQGWGCVVFNSRGCAHSPVTTPQFYSASFTEDLRSVVHHVARLYPDSPLYAIGWSLGANILVRYLGQEKESTPLAGAVSLCNPFDLVLADKNFHIGFNNVYDRNLAKSLNKIFLRHVPLFEGLEGEYNIPLVKTAKTVRDFDDGLTRVSFGYPTVDHYYADASSCHSIKDVKIPLLCIQAKDDPIAPAEGIPYQDIKENPNCLLVVTPYGGHLGWVAGPGAPLGAPWTDDIVIKFLQSLSGATRLDSTDVEQREEDGQTVWEPSGAASSSYRFETNGAPKSS